MTRLSETAITSLSPEAAFGYVAEFENIDQWDPGVAKSTKRSNEPTGVGSIYDLALLYRGRELGMSYEVTEFEPHSKIVLVGTGGLVKAIDTITFTPDAGGTRVVYQADLSLTGIGRLFQPFMKSRFDAIGTAAGEGLRRWLGELEQANA